VAVALHRVADGHSSIGSDTRTRTVTYISVTPVPPAADFTATPQSGDRPLSVQFTDTSSGAPTAWSWNFGDGSGGSTSQNPSHSYTTAGHVHRQPHGDIGAPDRPASRTNYITVNVPSCVVPSFKNTNTSIAQTTWNAAGFTTTVQFSDPPDYKIKSQTLVGGSTVPCDSVITVSP
jgi:PKD repeat protein